MSMSSRLDITRLQLPGVTEDLLARMIADLRGYWDADGGLDFTKVEAVECSLCGTPAPVHAIFSKERFPYHSCPSCGLVYPSPRPRQSYLKEQYVSGRFTAAFRELYLPSAPYRMETIFKESVEDIIAPPVPAGGYLMWAPARGTF